MHIVLFIFLVCGNRFNKLLLYGHFTLLIKPHAHYKNQQNINNNLKQTTVFIPDSLKKQSSTPKNKLILQPTSYNQVMLIVYQ